MDQIQEITKMNQADIAAQLTLERQQHADDLDRLSKELATKSIAINEVAAFVSSDSSAATYQSLGQYRTAILKMLHKQKAQQGVKV